MTTYADNSTFNYQIFRDFPVIKKCFTLLLVLAAAPVALAQHSDIEFGYDNGANPTFIDVEQPNTNLNGFMFFESEFEEEDPMGDPGNFTSDEPGFETSQDEMLTVNPNDLVWLQFLDASTIDVGVGAGFVNYYAPGASALQDFGRIAVEDNTNATADLILNGNAIESGLGRQFLGMGDDDTSDPGGIHDHVEFDLLDDGTTPIGAYGLLFQIESDLADGSGTVTSDPFWVIWNHGLSEDEFENGALRAFGVVPEPTSALFISATVVGILSRRRRQA